VFTPFSIQLRNTKPHVPAQGEQHQATPNSKFGEETHVLVPFINVTMDSKEFNILVDVINNVGVAEVPPPTPRPHPPEKSVDCIFLARKMYIHSYLVKRDAREAVGQSRSKQDYESFNHRDSYGHTIEKIKRKCPAWTKILPEQFPRHQVRPTNVSADNMQCLKSGGERDLEDLKSGRPSVDS
jgi:hypothetical protein